MLTIARLTIGEAARRRVLWVTPLAMLGVVAVTQISNPVDEQDAIRQATKYCLFASGIVVELPGLTDPDRAKEIVRRSAFLEFRITDETQALEKALPAITQFYDQIATMTLSQVAPMSQGAIDDAKLKEIQAEFDKL